MGVNEKPDIIDIIEKKRLQWYGHVKRMQEKRLPKLIMEWIPGERRKRGRPRKTWMEGVRAAMETKTFRSRSVVKQKGMVFGFRKTATAVTRPER
jgi:IS5 family transposase